MDIKEEIRLLIQAAMEEYMKIPWLTSAYGIPVIGYASADDPYFESLRGFVNPNHLLPNEVLPDAKTVIAYFIPFVPGMSWINEKPVEERSWHWDMAYGELRDLDVELKQELIGFLDSKGAKAVIPDGRSRHDHKRKASGWSLRHVCYAAGLGTWGMNNMLITRHGCCATYGTIVTNLEIEADELIKEELCLYKKDGSCGVCMSNCPTGALKPEGFDRYNCQSSCGRCINMAPCAFWSI